MRLKTIGGQAMKTITKCYQVAEFKEFSPEDQEKIIENYRDINLDFLESDIRGLLSEYKNDLSILGFTNIEIFYSGFYSQGDGASISGIYTPPKNSKEIKERLKLFKESCGIEKFQSLALELFKLDFSTDDDLPEKFIELVRGTVMKILSIAITLFYLNGPGITLGRFIIL